MALYFLDTNMCIYFLKGRYPPLRERLLRTHPEDIYVSAVVEAELWFGLEKIKAPTAAREKLRTYLRQFEIKPFDSQAAQHYARTRADLEAQGKPIGPNDLFIAAIALAHGATLVTKNGAEFSRVPGLAIEDWTLPE